MSAMFQQEEAPSQGNAGPLPVPVERNLRWGGPPSLPST